MKRPILCLLTVILLLFPAAGSADDLEIFGGKLVNLQPNVLIIIDTSMSMATNNRIGTAKTVVKELIDETDGVRFGLMAFNSSTQGGRIVYPCRDAMDLTNETDPDEATLNALKAQLKTELKNAIDDLSADVPGTPLAETLAEAGLYFAGESSWYSASYYDSSHYQWYNTGKYLSPIQHACQKNSVIVMTDGLSREDNDSKLTNVNYIGTDKIGDQDNDDDASLTFSWDQRNGSDYLDDVARFFQTHDMRPGWNPSGNSDYDDQHISVHTIGFGLGSTYQLLVDTADDDHGKGSYHTANDTTTLKAEFVNIVKNVLETNSTFAAPVIPLDPTNQTESGNRVYLSFFKPQGDGPWLGNLKAYELSNGVLKDATGAVAINTTGAQQGYIKDTARSIWTPVADGPDGQEVDKGGVGALLKANVLSRNLYTYLGTASDLTDSSNEFATGNSDLTAAHLGVAAGDRDSLIAATSIDLGGWPLGPIIHSVPHVETYADIDADSAPDDFIFVGANDGMLHVFDADTGSEAWAFVPPGQLARLTDVEDFDYQNDYSVDGSPVIEEIGPAGSEINLLIFGERRGGSRYYALDVTDPLAPAWKYQIADTLLNNAGGKLGQSWAKPQLKKIHSGGNVREVFLMAGGYDAANQDEVPPTNTTDAVGRAIYAVRADDGSVFGLNINGEDWAEMEHSILEVTGFDSRDRGYINRVYAGDLGGKLFAARYDVSADAWEKFVLLDLPTIYTDVATTQDLTLGRKFMTRPEATLETDGECIYLGTGDREHLLDTTSVDALYVVCNQWTKDNLGDYIPVAGLLDPVAANVTDFANDLKDKLVDVTSNKVQDGSVAEKNTVNASLEAGSGWFLRMEHAGEKIVSAPKVLNGKIYFTTFTPDNSLVAGDPCANNFDLGISRLYALDYRTGGAAFNLDGTGDKTKDDRSVIIGTSLANEPVLTTTGEKTSLLYGSGGKFEWLEVDESALTRRYFWRQLK